MKKYMKVGLVVLAAVTALSFGFTAIASAEGEDTEAVVEPGQIFVGKLADILGLDEGVVSDAVQQARQEMREEMQQQRLQNAIDEGLITEEEAQQIQDWWDSRPEALQQLGPPGGFGPHMHGELMQ